MEEAIVMKIIIGLTIITILGFIYLRRENKALDSEVSLFVGRVQEHEYEVNRLRHEVLVLSDEVISLRERLLQRDELISEIRHRLNENEHRLSQQDGLIEQIRHRVDAHEIRLFT